jgi:hypothetical protein
MQHPFIIKALKKLRIVGMYLNIIKTISDKAIANIILKRRKMKLFPPKSGMRQGYLSTVPLLFNIVLKFLVRTLRQEKENGYNMKERNQIIPIYR